MGLKGGLGKFFGEFLEISSGILEDFIGFFWGMGLKGGLGEFFGGFLVFFGGDFWGIFGLKSLEVLFLRDFGS